MKVILATKYVGVLWAGKEVRLGHVRFLF